MDFPNNDNFGIEDIQLGPDVQKNDQNEAERQTKATNFQNTRNSQGLNSMQLSKSSFNLNEAAHPVACIFTFVFKLSALLMYLLGGNFMGNTLVFILVLLMSAADFWTTKNITGRLLVGLRWWMEYDEKGNSIMRFESHQRQHQTNSVDSAFFWSSQLGFGAIWVLMILMKLISLTFLLLMFWFLLILLNFGLIATNLYAFYLCRKEYGQKLSDLKKMVGQKVVQGYMNS